MAAVNTRFIQIAGIANRSEAEAAVEAGATHIGFPLRLHDGREDLSEAAAAAVIARIGHRVGCVLITYQERADEIAAFCDALGVSGVQVHGEIADRELARLRRLRPGLLLIKSLVVRVDNRQSLLQQASGFGPWVDALITDTYDPQTGRSGATGLTHDWCVSRDLVRATSCPVILAGGLTPENVAEAVRSVRPAGVDAHTGVEDRAGRKDPLRMRAFVSSALAAWGEVDS